jgi:uncharacterized membrane protein YbhN (UPF0104 family)
MTETIVPAGRPARSWWPWLRLLAVLAILAALVSLLGAKAFATGLHVLTPGSMVAALGIGLATTALNALRWRMVAQRVGLTLPLGNAIAETYRAIFSATWTARSGTAAAAAMSAAGPGRWPSNAPPASWCWSSRRWWSSRPSRPSSWRSSAGSAGPR